MAYRTIVSWGLDYIDTYMWGSSIRPHEIRQEGDVLVVPYGPGPGSVRQTRGVLRIACVQHWDSPTLRSGGRFHYFAFDGVEYDADTSSLLIATEPESAIRIAVSSVDVTVEGEDP